MSYPSRNWKAVQTTDLVGSKYVLTVTGEVEVRKSNEDPKLAEHHPQGINPVTLILTLSVAAESPIGGNIVLWKPVEYVRQISPEQYRHVAITGETMETTIAVELILS